MVQGREALLVEVNSLLTQGLSMAAIAEKLETTESALRLRLARCGYQLKIERQFVPWREEES